MLHVSCCTFVLLLTNRVFGKQGPCMHDTRHSRHFRHFQELEEPNPLFWWLSGIVSRDSAAVQIRIRIVRCQRPAKRRNPLPCETQARFFPPLLPVGNQESVLKVPKRGQFHAAIRVTTKRCDSSALYRGEKPQNREKRVSELKTPHFPPLQKRASRVKKSPFSLWCPVKKWGFFDSRRPFLGWGEWGFSTPKPSFPDSGVFDLCTGRTVLVDRMK